MEKFVTLKYELSKYKPSFLLPYQLGIWFTQYGKSLCHICGFNQSQVILQRNRHPASAFMINPWQYLRPYLDKGVLCQSCHNDISWHPPALTVILNNNTPLTIQPAVGYNSVIRKAIIAFKYHADFSTLPLLVHVIRQFPISSDYNKHNSVIIPVPTTDKRLLKRGFDPVTILSRYLSQHWQIEIFSEIERIDEVVSQQGLSRTERLANVINAFELKSLPNVTNILLFDDVATTGSTLNSLANCVNNTNHPFTISAYAIAHGNS